MNIVDKIKALRRLSENRSATVSEAASAAARIQELMLKHQLTEDDLSDDEPIGEDSEPLYRGKTWRRWQGSLSVNIAQVNACRVVKSSDVGGIKRIRLVGRPEDRANVRYLFDYVSREIERHVRLHLASVGFKRTRNEAESYRLGFVEAVSARLKAMREEVVVQAKQEGNEKGIIRLDQRMAEIEAWASSRFPTAKTLRVTLSAGAWNAGKRDGEKLAIHRPVSGEPLAKPKLLAVSSPA